jgi:hypothetical protein
MGYFNRKTIVFVLVFILIFAGFTSMFVITGEPDGKLTDLKEDSNIDNIQVDQTSELEQAMENTNTPINSPIIKTVTKTNFEPVKVASLSLGKLENENLDDIDNTFNTVFSTLDDEVTVYPSENYLYYRYETDEKYIWGNFRLAPEERDSGKIHFAYYEFDEALTGPDDANIRHKLLGPEDGINIEKLNDFCYIVSKDDKKVIFNLHQLEQTPPELFTLTPSEDVVFKTYDESGYQYFLTFNRNTKNFYYILNEEESPLQNYDLITKDLAIDKISKFAYFIDSSHQDRKILMGVYSENVMQNSYYDGPFDQLADNYVDESCKLSEYIQQAYPFTQGQVDKYGNFNHDSGYRVAIMPYYIYETPDELADIVEMGKIVAAGDNDKLYSILAYDYQKEMDSDLNFDLVESQMVTENGEPINFDEPVFPPEPLVPENDDSSFDSGSGTRGLINWSYHSKLLSCLPWHTKNVTWKTNSSIFNWSKYHVRNITWCFHTKNVTYPWGHITNVTWPKHNISATWSRFHIKNITWWPHVKNVTYPWRHTRNVTWPTHTKSATWSKYHIKNITWSKYHIRNTTWPTHNRSATWSKYHVKNVTWRIHIKCVTYPPRHITNITWPTHNRSATWSKYHIKNVTWWPHVKNVTYPWRHVRNVTWPYHTKNATWSRFHIKNVTWRKHIRWVSYPPKHYSNVTWSKHSRNATWSKFHIKNVTWPGHVRNVTWPKWHAKNVTWPNHKRNVSWSKSHIKCITWRSHVRKISYPYWHIKNSTWPKHVRNVTWSSSHVKNVTWYPHKKCITWSSHRKGFSWTYYYKKIIKRIIINRKMIMQNMKSSSSCNNNFFSNNSSWVSWVIKYLRSKYNT